MNLAQLVGKATVGNVMRIQIRYTWITPYVTIGKGTYSTITPDFIDF